MNEDNNQPANPMPDNTPPVGPTPPPMPDPAPELTQPMDPMQAPEPTPMPQPMPEPVPTPPIDPAPTMQEVPPPPAPQPVPPPPMPDPMPAPAPEPTPPPMEPMQAMPPSMASAPDVGMVPPSPAPMSTNPAMPMQPPAKSKKKVIAVAVLVTVAVLALGFGVMALLGSTNVKYGTLLTKTDTFTVGGTDINYSIGLPEEITKNDDASTSRQHQYEDTTDLDTENNQISMVLISGQYAPASLFDHTEFEAQFNDETKKQELLDGLKAALPSGSADFTDIDTEAVTGFGDATSISFSVEDENAQKVKGVNYFIWDDSTDTLYNLAIFALEEVWQNNSSVWPQIIQSFSVQEA